MNNSFLDLVFPAPPDSEAERRQKFVDGLRFRAVCAASFFILFIVLQNLQWAQSTTFLPVLPVLAFLGLVNIPYWVAGNRSHFPLRHFYLHWLVDLITIAIVLHMLGGVDAPYGFFAYLMIVVTSATFISKRASLVVATGATIATVLLVWLERVGVLPHVEIWAHHLTPQVQIVTVSVVIAFYYIFAYLAGTLADQLKRANAALSVARKEIEEQNRLLEDKVAERTVQLEQRNAEIEEFVHIVTHDLKNLSVGATETARKLVAIDSPRMSDRGQRYAQHMIEDARTMNEMLRHLLAIFRIDQDARRLQRIDLNEVAKEIVRAHDARIEAKGIAVTIDPLPLVTGDEPQLKHVLANLVDNAIKYVGDKAAPEIRIRVEENEVEWIVEVADNGVGVAVDQRERIFNLYHRAPDQVVGGAVQRGDGVGLAICKRIVERWGGRIWLSSTVGTGSSFYFSVPTRPGQ